MTEESIFGLPLESSEEEIVPEETTSEPVADEAPSEGLPAEEAAPEEEPQTPDPVVGTDLGTDEIVDEEQPEEVDPVQQWIDSMPEGVQFAGKFNNPFEVEKAYNESRDMWRRANEARKAEAQRAMELQEQYGQLYSQMEQAVPMLQQAAQREAAYRAFADKYKEQYGAYPEGYQPPAPQPAPGPQDINAIVDQRLAQERAAMQAQYDRQLEQQALAAAVTGLGQTHPELDLSRDEDSLPIYESLNELNQSWDRYGIEVDPADQGSLEIAYEASRNPALLEVLKLNPQYFESAYGMELARRDAAVISGRVPATTEPVTKAVRASQVKASGERKPFTESAAVGASAPETEDENDPWVRIKNSQGPGATTPSGETSIFFE